MEEIIKVYCIATDFDGQWLTRNSRFKITRNFEEADMVIFPGGADWNPALYHESIGKHTSFYDDLDKFQIKKAIECIDKDKFMVGLCRGGQLMCILSGGKLIQNVSNHTGLHAITTKEGNQLFTNSLHHQMMDLPSIGNNFVYDVLAYSTNISDTYTRGDNTEAVGVDGIKYINKVFTEPEVVYFKTISGFAIQGHPEMGSMPDTTTNFIIDSISRAYNAHKTRILPPKLPFPTVVQDRLKHIKNFYKLQQTTTHDTTSKETPNRNSDIKKSREWSY